MEKQKRGPDKFTHKMNLNIDYYNLNRLMKYRDLRNYQGLPASRIVNFALREFLSKLDLGDASCGELDDARGL